MYSQNSKELNINKIKDEIFRLQNWVETEKLKGISIDDLLDNSTEFDKFENYLTEEEYSIFILTILNNFKSNDIIDMLAEAISKNKNNKI